MAGNTFGKIFTLTTFGESHGTALGCILDGCPPGLEISESDIQKELDKRKPGSSKYTTQRKEEDKVEILSGVFEGKTTGTPIGMIIKNKDQKSKRYITKSICFSAAKMANDIKAKAISTLTNSGYTAYQISSWRPKTHVLVFTSNKRILTQLNLLWGVKAFYYDGTESTDRTIEEINKIAVENKLLQKDDKVINLTSMPIEKKGMVNTVRVSKI